MIRENRSYCLKNDDRRDRLTISMFEMAPDAMLVIDNFSNIAIANTKAEELFQCFDFQENAVKAEQLFPDWENITSEIGISTNGKATKIITAIAEKLGGRGEFIAEVEPSVIDFDGTDFIGLVVRDITKKHIESRQLETTFQHLQEEKTQLEYLVKQDALTQLFNRRGLESILSREIEYARRNNSGLLAAIVDLDNFKMINDNFGHFTGDIVLRHVAGILKNTVRVVDWVGRVGGDEFLILLPGITLSTGAKVAERVRLELTRNIVPTADGPIQQTASFGLVELPLSICSIEEVLELTKSVLKESKSRGKNCVSAGGSVDCVAKADELFITNVVGELEGYRSFSQPIVDLRSKEIIGYELLVGGPNGPGELPNELFRRSRQNNTVALLDLHCLQIALTATKNIETNKIFHLNVCSSTLVDIPIENLLERIRQSTDGQEICISLSAKTMLSSPLCLLEPIRELKRQGVKIALTDVGFGHSSLEFVLYLNPDYIKLDRSLTTNISTNSDNRKCIRTLIDMVSRMDVELIAAGIENESELTALAALGVHFGQGSLFL